MIALAWASVAAAQSCSCSIGSSEAALPMGAVPAAGAVSLALDVGIGQTGGEPWEGVVEAADLQGNSMSEMAMPGHLFESGRLTGLVGLPRGFSVSAVVPYLHTAPLYPSDMPGDVSRAFVGDAAISGRWGHRQGGTFFGTGLTATLPTGPVVRGVGVRGGRGAVGAVLDTSALQMFGPVVGLAGRVGWTQGLYASPIDAYLVGPQLDTALGLRVWTREQGRLSFTGLTAFVHRGHDHRGIDVLDETGSDILSLGAGMDWRFWSERDRSMVWAVRGQAPVVQVVGDPWLAENWTLSTGLMLAL